MLNKAVLCALAALCILPIAAQQSDSIMTVEEAYLGSVESAIMRELVRSTRYDAKLTALQYIEEVVGSGGASSHVIEALCSLAGEGTLSISREGGRITNNYPDIRIRACNLLGNIGSAEAVPTLISLLYAESEPAVASAAVKALADIGYNENGRAIEIINWVARKFDTSLPPYNPLAMEILSAYEKLSPSAEEVSGIAESIIRIASNYNYAASVRDRAYEVLTAMWPGGEEDSSY